MRVDSIEPKTKAMAIARAASNKKALEIVTIDMRKIPSIVDYFVIASGASTTQVRAIKDHIMEKMGEAKQRLWHSEGERDGLWVLLDYGDVVGHIFHDEVRRFYNLERLWADAPQERFREARRRTPRANVKKRKRARRVK